MDDMYQSPIEITQIQEDLNIAFEDGVFKAVRRVGINVDKEELLKALAYDRGQYEQGYHDALKERPDKWISVKDRLPGIDEDVLILYESKASRKTGYAITCMKDSFYFGSTPIPYSTPQWLEPWQYFRENNTVTHWMLLPEPPGVKQE